MDDSSTDLTPTFDPSSDHWLDRYQPAGRRTRHDGWTADRQYEFLVALAESGCVTDACRAVGKSATSAYALRREPDAAQFRRAWDAALNHAVSRLSDAAIGRALNGTVRPVFYKGEQVGERRYFDERLTMFILRYRDPMRYGKWLDSMAFEQSADGPAELAEQYATQAHEDALAAELGLQPVERPPEKLHGRIGGEGPRPGRSVNFDNFGPQPNLANRVTI